MVIGVINQLSHTFGPRLFIGTLPPKKKLQDLPVRRRPESIFRVMEGAAMENAE